MFPAGSVSKILIVCPGCKRNKRSDKYSRLRPVAVSVSHSKNPRYDRSGLFVGKGNKSDVVNRYSGSSRTSFWTALTAVSSVAFDKSYTDSKGRPVKWNAFGDVSLAKDLRCTTNWGSSTRASLWTTPPNRTVPCGTPYRWITDLLRAVPRTRNGLSGQLRKAVWSG